MELKDRLRELRLGRGMTQEAVASYLGVSSQTVSKWERGLLSPDIMLLPQLAVLYRCSLDSLFGMDFCWGTDDREKFRENIRRLHGEGDSEAIYRAWINEIERHPEEYGNYMDVMLFVWRRRLLDRRHIDKMIGLAARAERYCTDSDILHQLRCTMVCICGSAKEPRYREMAREYYEKLPMMRHGKEPYACYVMGGEALTRQEKRTLMAGLGTAEAALRRLISPDMDDGEKLSLYRQAAAVYETFFAEAFGGFYELPMLWNYMNIAEILLRLGQEDEAREYVKRLLYRISRHFGNEINVSPFVPEVDPKGYASSKDQCRDLLRQMIKKPLFSPFLEDIRREQACAKRRRRKCYDKSKKRILVATVQRAFAVRFDDAWFVWRSGHCLQPDFSG